MIAVFVLLSLGLMLGVRWFAAEAAAAAAQRGLEIAQSPDGSESEAREVAVALATSSGIVNDVDVVVVRDGASVIVRVTAVPVIGDDVVRSVTGPVLRFVPQGEGTS
jgi:predicted homoserine dehydrogenase-like protein